MSRRMISVVSYSTCSLLLCLSASLHALQTQPPAKRTYNWVAEFVAADATTNTLTVKARIPEYIGKYVDRFKAGDRVTLIWNMLPPSPPPPAPAATPAAAPPKEGEKPAKPGNVAPTPPPPPIVLKTESDVLLAINSDSSKNGKLDTGYVLPAEFVSSDGKTVTVKLRVPEPALRGAGALQPGARLRATSSMSQAGDGADVSAVAMIAKP